MSDEETDDDGPTAIADGVESGPRRSPRNAGRRRGRPSKARGRPLSSDEAAFRWTVRGVPPPVRTIALKAAEDRGMTVGDWLAEAIVAFSRSGGRGTGAAAAATAAAGAADEVRSNLPATEAPPDLIRLVRNIDQRLTALERRQTASDEPERHQQRQPDEVAAAPGSPRERVGVLRRLFGRRR